MFASIALSSDLLREVKHESLFETKAVAKPSWKKQYSNKRAYCWEEKEKEAANMRTNFTLGTRLGKPGIFLEKVRTFTNFSHHLPRLLHLHYQAVVLVFFAPFPCQKITRDFRKKFENKPENKFKQGSGMCHVLILLGKAPLSFSLLPFLIDQSVVNSVRADYSRHFVPVLLSKKLLLLPSDTPR